MSNSFTSVFTAICFAMLMVVGLPSTTPISESISDAEYSVIRVKEGSGVVGVYSSTPLLLLALASYGTSQPSQADIHPPVGVDTQDLVSIIGGYGVTPPDGPDLSLLTITENFGEGVSFMECESGCSFAILHRTNGDEDYGGNYLGFDLQSFDIDIIEDGTTTTYRYFRKYKPIYKGVDTHSYSRRRRLVWLQRPERGAYSVR